MIKLLKNIDKREWLIAIVCFVFIIGQVWLELKMPEYMSEITVLVQTEGSQMSDIVKNGAYMLGCAFRKSNFSSYCWLFGFWNFSNIFYEN